MLVGWQQSIVHCSSVKCLNRLYKRQKPVLKIHRRAIKGNPIQVIDRLQHLRFSEPGFKITVQASLGISEREKHIRWPCNLRHIWRERHLVNNCTATLNLGTKIRVESW